MPAEKLQDMQNVVFTLPHAGGNSLLVAVTHNLQCRAGVDLVPTAIAWEIISITGASLPLHAVVDLIERSGPPDDGTFDATVSCSADNTSGGNWVVTVRFTSLYIHSLAGEDRTA